MSASPKRRHRPVLGLPGSRNLRYSPVTALTALDSRIGTPSLPLSFPRTLAYRCSMLLCFCFSNEFFFCPARVNCDADSVHGGGGQDGGSFAASNRRARASMRYIFHCANVAVLVLFVSGCDPILNIGGTFFPGWMVAILIGSALTVAIRYVFV